MTNIKDLSYYMHMGTSSEATDADWQRQLTWLAIPLMALARPEPLWARLSTHLEETNPLGPQASRRLFLLRFNLFKEHEALGTPTLPGSSSLSLSPFPSAEERRRDESPAIPLRHLTKYE